jgi:hypothetical protein
VKHRLTGPFPGGLYSPLALATTVNLRGWPPASSVSQSRGADLKITRWASIPVSTGSHTEAGSEAKDDSAMELVGDAGGVLEGVPVVEEPHTVSFVSSAVSAKR